MGVSVDLFSTLCYKNSYEVLHNLVIEREKELMDEGKWKSLSKVEGVVPKSSPLYKPLTELGYKNIRFNLKDSKVKKYWGTLYISADGVIEKIPDNIQKDIESIRRHAKMLMHDTRFSAECFSLMEIKAVGSIAYVTKDTKYLKSYNTLAKKAEKAGGTLPPAMYGRIDMSTGEVFFGDSNTPDTSKILYFLEEEAKGIMEETVMKGRHFDNLAEIIVAGGGFNSCFYRKVPALGGEDVLVIGDNA